MPKGVESLKYEGVSYNKQWVASQTLHDFTKHEKHQTLSEEQLKEVWQLARGTRDVEDVKAGMVDGVSADQPAPEVNKTVAQKSGKVR